MKSLVDTDRSKGEWDLELSGLLDSPIGFEGLDAKHSHQIAVYLLLMLAACVRGAEIQKNRLTVVRSRIHADIKLDMHNNH